MSGTQQRLTQYARTLARPANWSIVERVKEAARDLATNLGIDLGQLGARPSDFPDDRGVVRWQYSTEYDWVERDASGDSVGQIQLRTYFYSLQTADNEVYDYLRDWQHGRLHTLFNSGTYEGFLQGFEPIWPKSTSTEGPEPAPIGEVPASGLGVPRWEVEIYNADGDLWGYANGYSLDFGVEDIQTAPAPEGEVWRILSNNRARDTFELGPEGDSPARERLKAAGGKLVFINGFKVGQIWGSRGTTELHKESSPTYVSRDEIVAQSGAYHQTFQTGTRLYKVFEDEGSIVLSTTEPEGFSAVDPEDVDADATGLPVETLTLNEDEPTQFVVLEDETTDAGPSWCMGKYDPPVARRIARTTDLELHQPSRR